MSSYVVQEQMERLALAGFIAPTGEKLALMVAEWTRMLGHHDAAHIIAGVDWVIQHRTDRWWPTVGEVLAAIRAAAGPKPEVSYRCHSCQGTGWVEAVPFRSMGQLYEGMRRCPECGIPEPSYSVPKGSRVPMSSTEHRDWLLSRPTPPALTEEQFYVRLREMGAARLVDKWQTLPADAPVLRRPIKAIT